MTATASLHFTPRWTRILSAFRTTGKLSRFGSRENSAGRWWAVLTLQAAFLSNPCMDDPTIERLKLQVLVQAHRRRVSDIHSEHDFKYPSSLSQIDARFQNPLTKTHSAKLRSDEDARSGVKARPVAPRDETVATNPGDESRSDDGFPETPTRLVIRSALDSRRCFRTFAQPGLRSRRR
jgi:hypothetical protein